MQYRKEDGDYVGLDVNGKKIGPGDPVEVKETAGKYGQTRTIRGVVTEVRKSRLCIELAEGTDFSRKSGRGLKYYSGGDLYTTGASSGAEKGSLFHRHENYIKLLDSIDVELDQKPDVDDSRRIV